MPNKTFIIAKTKSLSEVNETSVKHFNEIKKSISSFFADAGLLVFHATLENDATIVINYFSRRYVLDRMVYSPKEIRGLSVFDLFRVRINHNGEQSKVLIKRYHADLLGNFLEHWTLSESGAVIVSDINESILNESDAMVKEIKDSVEK